METEEGSGGESADSNSQPQSKVAIQLEKHQLSGFGDELKRRWLGESRERQSLRDLADFLNRRILQKMVEQTNELAVNGEIENLYRLLTGDDVSASDRARAEQKLTRSGIDVENIRADFVSHQAVHTYLTKVRGVNLDTSEESSSKTLESRKKSIQKLRSRLTAMTEWNIQNLQNTNRLSLGSFDVTSSVTVHCRDCDKSYDVTELLDKGQCEC
jgi:hypothetical protein